MKIGNIKSEYTHYTIDDLEDFRNNEGFIDLEKTDMHFSLESRERIGNAERVKNWIKFNDTYCLFKGETLYDGKRTDGIYAELIVEEIAKQLGIPAAHYDLAKYGDTLGVLSTSMINSDENLFSLRDIIGDEPSESSPFADTTSIEFTVSKLEEALLRNGFSKEETAEKILDYKKQCMFNLFTLDQDKHTENISFILNKKEKSTRLAPIFDSESALLLDSEPSLIKDVIDDYYSLVNVQDVAEPKIGTFKSIEDGGFASVWKDTLLYLTKDKAIVEYYKNEVFEKVDMDQVLENVETRIHAKLPDEVKGIAKYSLIARQDAMYNIITQKTKTPKVLKEEKAKKTLEKEKNLTSFFSSKQIRTGEQKATADKLIAFLNLIRSDSADNTIDLPFDDELEEDDEFTDPN